MEEKTQKKWYVIRAISGKERKTKEYIEKEISQTNLQEYVSQILIPTEKVFQLRKGKKFTKERNFFPGYILIEAELIGEVIHMIKGIPGVMHFLSTKEGIPIPLKIAEVNKILGTVDEQREKGTEIKEMFVINETVKIIDGPFNDFMGVIEEINEEKKKLKISVKIFDRKTPIELSFLQVEKQ